jgi:hypothetical protein
MADPQPVSGIQIVIDDEDGKVTTDPVTGTVATEQPDGGVVVQLDARRPKKDGDDTEDKFYDNLADEIGASQLSLIANELHDQIAADDRSRGNHLEIRARGLGLLGLELKEPRATVGDTSAAVEGQSTVTNPLLLEACLKGWANAQAELLPSDGPVKVANKDDQSIQSEDNLADAFERDLNHYFTKTATEYYPDTSHMLLWGTYFGGSGFKKIYRCPMKRRPVSESVDEKDLIVSDTTKDLRSCARITHQIPMRPSVMKRMELIGAYRKGPESIPSPPQVNAVDAKIAGIQGTDPTPQKSRPEDQPYTIWESQCELDLPEYAPGKFKGEGIALPYLVTMDKDSKEIKAIRRDWEEDDEECERQRMYVKYPYVPGPGFYGTGLLNILGNASSALTAAWRLALDSAMFATFPSFLIAKLGGRQNTSDFRVGPGTGVPVETNNQPIGNIISPMPYKDVGPGMLALIDKVQQQTQSLSAAGDIPTAEGVANVPVGTMLAQIEQATKVESAAHKGMHQAQAEEIELIVDLFRKNPEDFWKANKICPPDYWNEQKFMQALENCHLEPASDPNTPSHIHRVAKAVALSQLIAVPAFAPIMDPRGTLNTILGVIRQDPTNIIAPEQAPAPAASDPNMIAANAKMLSAQAAQQKAQVAAQEASQDMTIQTSKLQAEQNIATVDLAKEMVIHKDDAAHDAKVAAQQHSLGQQQHGLATAQHGLATQQAVHDANMDVAEHALNVHQVLNPPAPTDSGSE